MYRVRASVPCLRCLNLEYIHLNTRSTSIVCPNLGPALDRAGPGYRRSRPSVSQPVPLNHARFQSRYKKGLSVGDAFLDFAPLFKEAVNYGFDRFVPLGVVFDRCAQRDFN